MKPMKIVILRPSPPLPSPLSPPLQNKNLKRKKKILINKIQVGKYVYKNLWLLTLWWGFGIRADLEACRVATIRPAVR